MAVNLVQACLYFSCGMFTNNRNNIILQILSFVSPFTYTTEGMMHILLNKVKFKTELLTYFKFDKDLYFCA